MFTSDIFTPGIFTSYIVTSDITSDIFTWPQVSSHLLYQYKSVNLSLTPGIASYYHGCWSMEREKFYKPDES